jgi:hypothetical protein
MLSPIRMIIDSLTAYSVMIAPYYKNHAAQIHTIRDKMQSLVISEQLVHITNCGFQNVKISFIFRYSSGDLQWYGHMELSGREEIYTKIWWENRLILKSDKRSG